MSNIIYKINSQHKETDLSKKAEEMHRILKFKLRGGNDKVAQEAQFFLNWLIFNQGQLAANKEIDDTYRQLLMSNSDIQYLVSRFQEWAKISKDKMQPNNQLMSEAELDQFLQQVGELSLERGNETEEMLTKLGNALAPGTIVNTGSNQSTVIVEKWAQKILQNTGVLSEEYIKKLIVDGKKIRFKNRSMKADLKGSGLIEGEITYTFDIGNENKYIQSCIKALSNTTVKSVNNIKKIHLEEVDVNKAYLAFMRFAYSNKYLTQKALKNIFSQEAGSLGVHLNHLLRIYAYSGFGTTDASNPLEDLNNISQGVEYLVVVDNIKKQIYVKPSSKIIDYLLKYKRNKINPNVVLNLEAVLKASR